MLTRNHSIDPKINTKFLPDMLVNISFVNVKVVLFAKVLALFTQYWIILLWKISLKLKHAPN